MQTSFVSSSKAQKNSNALDGPLMVGKVKADIKEMTGTFKGGYTLYAVLAIFSTLREATLYAVLAVLAIRYTLYSLNSV